MSDQQSLKDRVKARREALQRNTTKTFDLPGYDGILKVRYKVLGLKAMTRAEDRSDGDDVDNQTRMLYMAADVLLAATDAVLDADTGKPAADGRWSAALAQDFFGVQVGTPRQAILAAFPRELMLMTHYRTVRAWQVGEIPVIDGDLAGESEPPQPSS